MSNTTDKILRLTMHEYPYLQSLEIVKDGVMIPMSAYTIYSSVGENTTLDIMGIPLHSVIIDDACKKDMCNMCKDLQKEISKNE